MDIKQKPDAQTTQSSSTSPATTGNSATHNASSSGRTAQLKTLGYAAGTAALRPSEPPVQRAAVSSETDVPLQAKPTTAPTTQAPAPAARSNQTGLPDTLKSGVESLSGMSLDGVNVHYNSGKPAELGANAFAQGRDIHVGPGQEQHLPHEAWHVVQQAQGRVQSTTQMKGVEVNDDAGLEHEADVMGAKAIGVGGSSGSAVHQGHSGGAQPKQLAGALVSPKAVVQGNFPDNYNDERKQGQGLKKDAAQMDHMVSQKTLKAFSDTYKTLLKLTSEGKSAWTETKEAMELLRKAAKMINFREHEFMAESHLINIPQNIVPGLSGQIQGPGDNFDPQVKKTKTSGNHARYEETAVSLAQRTMDVSMRKLNGLIYADALPSRPADTKNPKKHDSATDTLIASELKIIATAFESLAKAPEPNYDKDVWYHYGEEDNAVKKRPADWIQDESQYQIGGVQAPPRAPWQHQFTIQTHSLGTDSGKVTLVPVTVAVNVNVPASTWKHLYDRHYLPTFAGKIEAVDTFWKTDPYDYVTSAPGTQLLEKELKLLLGMSFNFSKPLDNLDYDTQRTSWSDAAHKLFFQGDATSEVQGMDINGIDYDVPIILKSIAPQDPDLALALLPSQLE